MLGGVTTQLSGIRARNRAAIETEIMVVAGRHLAAYGAAALSLRAIARDLGMASSAIYRYVESRDELLTRLIVAAYDALGDAVDAALAAQEGAPPAEQFGIVAHALRDWARQHPHEYSLIYGSPVPDYHAPAERTVAAGTRVPRLLVEILARWDQHPEATELDQRAFGTMLADPMFEESPLTAGTLRRGVLAWTLILGAVSTEIFEQLGADSIADPDAFFDLAVDAALRVTT